MPAAFDYDLLLHPRGRAFAQLAQLPDSDGRPCAAEGFLTDAQAQGLDRRGCPYPGSRHHHALPMNLTALRQISKHWEEMMGLVQTLRTTSLERPGRVEGGLLDTLRLAHAAVSLVVYCFSRSAPGVGPGTLPAFVSGTNKAYFDIETTCGLMLLQGLLSGEVEAALSAPISAEGLLAFAEEAGLLIGKRGVCAGPASLIQEAIETLLPTGVLRAEHATRARDWLGDVPRFLDYADASFLIDKLKAWHFVRQRAHVVEAASRLEASTPLRESLLALDGELADAARSNFGEQPLPGEACDAIANGLHALILHSDAEDSALATPLDESCAPLPEEERSPSSEGDRAVLWALLRKSDRDERWLLGALQSQCNKVAQALGRPTPETLTVRHLETALGPRVRPWADRQFPQK